MALTASNPFEIKKAPAFTLPDTISGKITSLEAVKGTNGTLILFICNHCPYVIHVNELLVKLADEYQTKGIKFIAISSNDVEKYPADSPEKMTAFAKENHYSFPYLYDESQEVARAYDAACTPDVFLFDANLEIYYHGQLDDSRPGNDIAITGKDIKRAFDLLLDSQPFSGKELPSMGCGIKWK